MAGMKIVRHEWGPGHSFRAKPEAAAAVFDEIRERDGVLTPAGVVDASRDPDAPLHGDFTWDDERAAELHRQSEARSLIRSLVVVYKHPETGREIPTRREVSLARLTGDMANARRYVPVHAVLDDPAQRQALVEQARRELAGWANRFRELQELAGVVAAIDAAIQQLTLDRAA